ncbi:ubiquitin carboxyl-terminal hydrolase 38 [Nematostella vectensis]|uniref:ubiquitin carboxyl-terminal hydrolase 38 n=1 Tax=Nematostella vectensis TaxID=45351 RepID=UPI00207749A4|nr:ubiquitin carboxyl-terminal hydrolase 38 [Nematostella vectensis]
MDQILRGIVASDHPENVKKSLIQQLVSKAASDIPEEQCNALYEMSCQWMAEGNAGFLGEMGKLLLLSWGKHHKEIFQRFFTETHLINLLESSEKLSPGHINFVRVSFDLLQHTPQIFSLYTLVRHRVHTVLTQNLSIELGAAVCRLLIEYPHCWPVGERLLQVNVALICALSKTQLPKSSKSELKSCIQSGGLIGALLNQIWTKNQNLLFPVLTEIFNVISMPGTNPSVALASVVGFFSPEVITTATRLAASNPAVTDERMALALGRMISWLSWPGGKRVDQWIVSFLRALAMSGKHGVLINVTLEKLPQVFSRLLFPVVRESTMVVLSHMLLSFQHSPQAFHLIVEHVPDLVKSLRKEDSVSSKACLQTLAELMHCLMYQHSGFPELYSPVLDCLQDMTKPSDAMIRKWLAQSAWSAQAVQLASPRITSKSETGRTGLVNLGNTCYMNSVLQSLYMLEEFRSLVMMKKTVPQCHKVLSQLQEVFAFLSLSQRAAFAPSKFLHAARPPWFAPGTQQDCSEFLKYMLDRLEEEDKIQAGVNRSMSGAGLGQDMISNIIEDTFSGRLIVCHSCRRCRHVSCREEAFTDLPLAFPHQRDAASITSSPKPDNPEEAPATDRSLKGGDIGQRPPAASITAPDEEAVASDESSCGATAAYSYPSQVKSSATGIGASDPSISLEEMLGYFFEPEMLEGSNQYHCERCQGLQDAERSVVIANAPMFLVLTLKRFSYNVRTHERSKILQSVSYPARLQLSNVCVPPSRRNSVCENDSANSQVELNENISESLEAPPPKCTRQDFDSDYGSAGTDDPFQELRATIAVENFPSETMYALTSVIVHSGTSSESGHYYCYAIPSGRVSLTKNAPKSVQTTSKRPQDNLKNFPSPRKTRTPSSHQSPQSAPPSSPCTPSSSTAPPLPTNPKSPSEAPSLNNPNPRSSCTTPPSSDTTNSSSAGPSATNNASPSSSPYVASAPGKDSSASANSWYLLNDSRVSYASFESFSDITKRFPKDTPYVLIYKNISRAPVARVGEQLDGEIRQDLVDAVTRDNLQYLQESERSSSHASRGVSHPPRSDDDGDNGPSGSCGPGSGFNAPFNRFVF